MLESALAIHIRWLRDLTQTLGIEGLMPQDLQSTIASQLGHNKNGFIFVENA